MLKFGKVFIIHYEHTYFNGFKFKTDVRTHAMFGSDEEQVRRRFLDTPGFYGYESRIVKIESEPIEGSRYVGTLVA